MGTGGLIGTAIGTGMKTFGDLEAQRRGGGGGSSQESAPSGGSQKTVEAGVKKSKGIDIDEELAREAGKKTEATVRPVLRRRVVPPSVTSVHKGGRISKSGVYNLLKGEVVLPADVVDRLEKRKSTRKTGRGSTRS